MVTWSGKTVCKVLLAVGRRKPVLDAPAPPMPPEIRGNLSSDTLLSSYCTYITREPSNEPHVAEDAFVTSSAKFYSNITT